MSRHIEPQTEAPDALLSRVQSRLAGRQMAKDLFDLIREHLGGECIDTLRKLAGLVPAEKSEPSRHCNPLFPEDPSMCFADADECACQQEQEE